jgi:hypothetical protein
MIETEIVECPECRKGSPRILGMGHPFPDPHGHAVARYCAAASDGKRYIVRAVSTTMIGELTDDEHFIVVDTMRMRARDAREKAATFDGDTGANSQHVRVALLQTAADIDRIADKIERADDDDDEDEPEERK